MPHPRSSKESAERKGHIAMNLGRSVRGPFAAIRTLEAALGDIIVVIADLVVVYYARIRTTMSRR